MTTIILKTIERTYKNNGSHAQQVLDYTLTGQMRAHDHCRWDEGSDIPELDMSVKTDRFTLASDLIGETLTDKVDDYMARTASKVFAYVATTGIAYLMNAIEFKAFMLTFCKLERDSQKNGGRMKVRFPHETAKVREWLERA